MLKDKIVTLLNYMHVKIFKQKMGLRMKKFIVSLSWSLIGGTLAAFIIFVTNLFAARWLGPIEYGKYNLVLALTSFFIIPMMLGFEVAAGRFISFGKNEDEINSITRYILKKSIKTILVTSCLFFLVFILFGDKLIFPRDILYFSLILAIVLSFKGIANGILRGKNQFKKQSVHRFFESILIGLVFLSVFFIYKRTYESYIVATFIGYVYFVLSSIGKDFFYLKNNVYRNKEILQYGRYAFWGLFSAFLLTGSDKILINEFMDVSAVGIYSVYFTVSIAPLAQLRYIFINVFFPEISSISDKTAPIKKINRLILVSSPFFFIIYPIVLFFLMKLFGEEYPIDLVLIFLFTLYAFQFFYVGINQWILASISTKSMRTSSVIAFLSGIFQIILTSLSLFIVKDLRFLLIAIIISNFFYMVLNNYYINKNLKKI